MGSDKLLEIVDAIERTHKETELLLNKLSGGPPSYYFGQLREYIEGLFSFAHYKKDDLVELAHNIDCSDAPGWQGSEHFLKRGARCVIDDVGFSKGTFTYGVVFENETWIDSKGEAQPVSSKHQYGFKESSLRPPVRKMAVTD